MSKCRLNLVKRQGRGVLPTTLFLFLTLTVTIAPTSAADIQWNGGFSQYWHVEYNWDYFGSPFSIRRIPTDIDTANLLTPANDVVLLGGNTEPINGLIVSNGIDLYTAGFLLQVDDAGTANTAIAGSADLHVAARSGGGVAFETDALLLSGSGDLLIEGGEVDIQGNATLFTGGRILGTTQGSITFGGNLTMIDNTELALSGFAFANFSAGANVSVEQNSTIDLEQQLDIIDSMSFSVEDGSSIITKSLNIGNDGLGTGSTGSLVLDKAGGTSTFAVVEGDLSVGHATDGSGLLHFKSAGIGILGTTTLNATGTIQLEGTGALFTPYENVAVDGGTITISDGNDSINMQVGKKLTVTNGGSVSITGSQKIRDNTTYEFFSGSDFEVTQHLRVGAQYFGTGTLTLDGLGTTLTVGGDFNIGNDGLGGSVTLSNNAVGNTSYVIVGNDSVGDLLIESGAKLYSQNSATISLLRGSSGSVTVTGSGSLWDHNGWLAVGFEDDAELNIENGGRVLCTNAYFGADPNGTGTAVVTGAGSEFTMSDSLYLGGIAISGSQGLGDLDIQSGGYVSVGVDTILYAGGTLQLTGGTLSTPTFDFQGGSFQWTSGTLHVENYPQSLVNQGGILAPGESAGSTTITGDYTQQTGAALEIEIGGTTAGYDFDEVTVTGAALLGGDLLLKVIDGFSPSPTDTFVVLDAQSGLSGLFDNVANGARLDTIDGIGSFTVHYGSASAYDPNQIVLADFLRTYEADFDVDGDVDSDDRIVWEAAYGGNGIADADGDGDSDSRDFFIWQRQYGSGVESLSALATVPEPNTLLLLLSATLPLTRRRLLS